ncbi:MAG: DUF4350 domain-containing protein [Candidatus Thiodiazotropha sp.]
MTHSRTNGIILALLVILLSVLGGYWFFDNFERQTKELRLGAEREARENPLLATQMTLERLGVTAESQPGRNLLTQLPDTAGLILIHDLGPSLNQTQQSALLEWVAQGGYLVASPGSQWGDSMPHSLMETFSVSLREDDDYASDDLSWVELPGLEEPLQVAFDNTRWFEIAEPNGEARLLSQSERCLTYAWGSGRVSFLSDTEMFTNEQIGEHDHARLLAYFAPPGGHAWLLYGADVPSLPELLWRFAPYLVITLLAWMILSLWRMGQQSGPKLGIERPARRDLLEHLQASAEFAWRLDPRNGLLRQARQQVEKRWLSAHPGLLNMDPQQRCAWLSERTGMTARSINAALYPDPRDPEAQIKTTAHLQRLYSALHPERKLKAHE